MVAEKHPLFDEWNRVHEEYQKALRTWDHLCMKKAPAADVEAAKQKLEQACARYENVSAQI
ncbi:hypothetical protein IHQ71_24220 [Rhizobium sp. TH2]|uniref:hypothetical protein n=1 Tax=Rhizobium sp. TH2 TaxID=2775403 RepID=UPI002158941D|nr:hypothetical protein [Rhizobium sp. TH2]UVC08226.1 hypothetical protein IHQ71_24220 [Rhizobium sp. TH2]